ncbi:MAG: hypothetical protein OEY49_13730 [Candidatus Heimdallarchaeota archaeon]|nr:hypothetical protein [Candidatus Heimdallarchaeota archaeon]
MVRMIPKAYNMIYLKDPPYEDTKIDPEKDYRIRKFGLNALGIEYDPELGLLELLKTNQHIDYVVVNHMTKLAPNIAELKKLFKYVDEGNNKKVYLIDALRPINRTPMYLTTIINLYKNDPDLVKWLIEINELFKGNDTPDVGSIGKLGGLPGQFSMGGEDPHALLISIMVKTNLVSFLDNPEELARVLAFEINCISWDELSLEEKYLHRKIRWTDILSIIDSMEFGGYEEMLKPFTKELNDYREWRSMLDEDVYFDNHYTD